MKWNEVKYDVALKPVRVDRCGYVSESNSAGSSFAGLFWSAISFHFISLSESVDAPIPFQPCLATSLHASIFLMHMYLFSLRPRHRSQSVPFLNRMPFDSLQGLEGTGFLYDLSTVGIALQFSLSQCISSPCLALLAFQSYGLKVIHTPHYLHDKPITIHDYLGANAPCLDHIPPAAWGMRILHTSLLKKVPHGDVPFSENCIIDTR